MNTTKRPVRVALIMLVIGLVVCFVGLAMGGFNMALLFQAPTFEQKTFTAAAQGINAIVVEEDSFSLIIRPSQDGMIRLLYPESDDIRYTIDQQGSTLHITHKDTRRWLERQFFWMIRETLVLELPAHYTGNLSVRSDNASMTIDDLKIEGALTLITENGSLHATRVNVTGALTAESDNGKLSFTSVTAAQIKAETSNGSVEIEQVSGDRLQFKTRNGTIKLHGIAVGTLLECVTDNGSIRGDVFGLMSDFAITSHTDNGSNNLPARTQGGTKQMIMETDNGRIEINFIP